jgi:hypothetical protein
MFENLFLSVRFISSCFYIFSLPVIKGNRLLLLLLMMMMMMMTFENPILVQPKLNLAQYQDICDGFDVARVISFPFHFNELVM